MNRRYHPNRTAMSTLWMWLRPVLLVGVAVAAGVAAFHYTRQGHYLVVKQVEVIGNCLAPTSEVLEYAGIELGTSLYRVNLDAVQKAVLQHPEVASATVTRVPPDKVLIQIAEHVTRATVALGDGIYLVNRGGRTFRKARAGEALDVPAVTGVPRAYFSSQPERALALLGLALAAMDAHGAAGRSDKDLSEVQVDEVVGITVRLGEPGMAVVLGKQDFDAKFKRLKVLEQELRARKQQASYVFLDNARHPERVALRLVEPLVAAVAPVPPKAVSH